MKLFGLTAVLLLPAAALLAADTPGQQVSDTIVVTASALPETIESTPAAVTVFTRKEIDARAAHDVADVLREVPGVTVSRTGSPGRATSLFTRGSSSTHTLVLWNGIEINNPYFAGYDWGRFSTVGVQQVEVVRGPFSALYGSDAMAGVVNVLTTPSHSGVQAAVEAGGRGFRSGEAAASWVEGAQLFTASLEKRSDEGFAPNDDFDQKSVNALWRFSPASNLSLGIAGRYTDYDLGIPFNLDAAGSALIASPQRRQNGNERQIAVPLSATLGPSAEVELTLSDSHRRDDFADPEDPWGFVSSTTESTTLRARLSARFATAIGTIVAGGEGSRATVDDVSNFGPNLDHARRNDKSLFVEDRISRAIGATQFEVSAGVRHDDFGGFGRETSPRLAAALLAGGGKIRAAVGSAFRAPSIGELYFPFSGNRDLRAERTRSTEIGYDRAFRNGDFSVTAFQSRFRDLIVFDNATYAFANIGRASSRGIETAVSFDPARGFHTALSYTWLHTREEATRAALLRRPAHSGSLFAGYSGTWADVNAVMTYGGSRLDVLPVAPFARVSDRAYTTLDLNLQTHLGRVTPFVKVENATDTRYEEVRGYPSPRRRAMAGVKAAFW